MTGTQSESLHFDAGRREFIEVSATAALAGAPNRRELDCLQIAAEYESASNLVQKHRPALLG